MDFEALGIGEEGHYSERTRFGEQDCRCGGRGSMRWGVVVEEEGQGTRPRSAWAAVLLLCFSHVNLFLERRQLWN